MGAGRQLLGPPPPPASSNPDSQSGPAPIPTYPQAGAGAMQIKSHPAHLLAGSIPAALVQAGEEGERRGCCWKEPSHPFLSAVRLCTSSASKGTQVAPRALLFGVIFSVNTQISLSQARWDSHLPFKVNQAAGCFFGSGWLLPAAPSVTQGPPVSVFMPT